MGDKEFSIDVLVNTEGKDDSLYERMLADLMSGALHGGQRLKVAELADRYGVSTSPVREVLRQMQGEGFVEITHNRGAIVRKADRDSIQNIFEILELLTPYFVAWFADFAQPDMVRELEEIQDQIEQTPIDDLLEFRRLDALFHWAICKRHYNKPAIDLWRNMRRALNVHGVKLRISPTRYANIMAEHREMVEAFRNNDRERALAVSQKHSADSFKQMSQQMRILGM